MPLMHLVCEAMHDPRKLGFLAHPIDCGWCSEPTCGHRTSACTALTYFSEVYLPGHAGSLAHA